MAPDVPPTDSAGQSLVETIVACGVIVTAVAAALTLSTAAIRAERESETMIVAGNLAREGIESVRSVRDSNWLASAQWDAGLFGASNDYTGAVILNSTTGNWSVDFTPNVMTDDGTHVYRYSAAAGNAVIGLMVQSSVAPASATATNYRRLITLDPLCDNGAGSYTIVISGSNCGTNKKIGIRVTSTVQWTVSNNTKQLSIEERMFDWH